MTDPKSKGTTQPRDWPILILAFSIAYLVLLFPLFIVIGGKPEVVAGAIGILATTMGGIIGVRAARK